MFLRQKKIIWNLPKGPLHDSQVEYTHNNNFPLNWTSICSTDFSPEPSNSTSNCLLSISIWMSSGHFKHPMFKLRSWYCSMLYLLSTPHISPVSNTYLQTISRTRLLTTSAAAVLVQATVISLTWITVQCPLRFPCSCPCLLFSLVSK